jgi:hypothetical protein
VFAQATQTALQHYRIAGWKEVERVERLGANRFVLHGTTRRPKASHGRGKRTTSTSKADSLDILRVMKLPGVNPHGCSMNDFHAMVGGGMLPPLPPAYCLCFR